MNIYDTKQIKCSICAKAIGEISYNSSVMFPLCSVCNRREKQIIQNGIKKILVPVDITKKSTKALDAAIYLSKHLNSSITIMQVIPTASIGSATFFDAMFNELSKDAKKSIDWAKKYCESKNVTVKYRIAQGDEAQAIVKTAKKLKFDLIIMGSSGKGAFKEILFGSISNYVMHNSSIPVLTLKDESSKLGTRIHKKRKNVKSKPKKLRGGNGIPLSKMKQRVKSK